MDWLIKLFKLNSCINYKIPEIKVETSTKEDVFCQIYNCQKISMKNIWRISIINKRKRNNLGET